MSQPAHRPLVVRDLTVRLGGRTVLSGLELLAQPGRRIGLVGENGAGKSTLLRAVARRLPRHAHVSGCIEAPSDVVLIDQEPPFDPTATVGQVLDTTLQPLRRAVADVERLAAALPGAEEEYAARLEWALTHDAWDADRRAAVAAHRLGLDGIRPERLVGTLSGGERTRLALATVMTSRPSCLLLDEPTNHLDDSATEVLTGFLRELPGVVLLASHDRVLLDDVATDLVDLDPAGPGTDGEGGRRFGGGWSAYEHHRDEMRRRWEQTWAEQQEELARLREQTRIGTSAVAQGRGPRDNDRFVHHFKGGRVQSTLARRKRQARQRLEHAERAQVPKPPSPLRLDVELAAAARDDRPLVQVRGLHVADRLRLSRLDVRAGEHLLVTGGNGAGKSTLLGVLAGRIPAPAGTVRVDARRVAELPQDVTFGETGLGAEATYRRLVGAATAEHRPLRELGLLHPRELRTPVAELSVGQRRRLGLAVAVAGRPDLLLLDEPTNHISLTLAGELEEALAASPGTLVVATHDRWLRRRWDGPEVRLSRVGGP